MPGHFKSLPECGGIVGYTDKQCQAKMSGRPTKYYRVFRRLVWALLIGGIGGWSVDTETRSEDDALVIREASPESEEGKFVQIFDELADEWAARRYAPAHKMVKRNLKVVS